MISRRSIRIKAMKALYSFEKDDSITALQLKKQVEQSIRNSYNLYVLNLFLISKAAEYVNELNTINASKHIASELDKNYSVKIFHNTIIQRIISDINFINILKKERFDLRIDTDIFKKYFMNLYSRNSYKKYIQTETDDIADDFYLITELFQDIIAAEDSYDNMLEDIYPNWTDDKESILEQVKLTLQQLKDKPGKRGIINAKEYKEEIKLADLLIDNYLTFPEEYKELIKPRLKNWDEDRLAEIDLIIIRMGLSEFLHAPEIPFKVTINEYLEIAKNYSTPKSKDFINGVLDNILKELKSSNKVNKEGRGIIEA